MDNNHSHPTRLYLYHSDKIIRPNLFFSLTANLFLWLFLLWQVRNFPESISLHYNIYFGIDLLGLRYQTLLLPALGLIFLVINFLAGLIIFTKERILSYFLAGLSSFEQLIFILAVIFIVLVNQ